MHERHYGEVGTHHDMGKKRMMKKTIWEQLHDDAKTAASASQAR
jgi:hypothetical protein